MVSIDRKKWSEWRYRFYTSDRQQRETIGKAFIKDFMPERNPNELDLAYEPNLQAEQIINERYVLQ